MQNILFRGGVFLKLAFVLLSCSLILSACQEQNEIRLGFIGGLTGKQSSLGLAARNGAILAVDELNDRGGILGKHIVLETFDGQGNPQIAQIGIESYKERGITLIIGPLTSNVIPIVQSEEFSNMLFLSPTISSSLLTGQTDNIVRFNPDTNVQAQNAARLLTTLGVKRLSVYVDQANAEYTELVLSSLRDSLVDGNMQIIPVYFNGSEAVSYTKLAKQAADQSPDAYFALSSGFDAGRLVQAVRQLIGVGPAFIICDWAGTRDFIEIGGLRAEGAYLSRSYISNTPSPRLQRFNMRYLQRFGTLPDFSSKYTYEALWHLAKAAEAAGSLSTMELHSHLHNARVDGFDETYSIDEYGDAQRSQSYAVVTRGTFISQRFDPEP